MGLITCMLRGYAHGVHNCVRLGPMLACAAGGHTKACAHEAMRDVLLVLLSPFFFFSSVSSNLVPDGNGIGICPHSFMLRESAEENIRNVCSGKRFKLDVVGSPGSTPGEGEASTAAGRRRKSSALCKLK